MRIFRTFLSVTVLSVYINTGFSQKLISDGYKISLKSIEKRERNFHSSRNIIFIGDLKVNSKDSLKGKYLFYFLEMEGNIGVLSIKNTKNEILRPKLVFNKDKMIFTYNQGTEMEGNEKINNVSTIEDILLSGMLVWLKYNSPQN